MNISFYVLFGKALYERVLPKNQNKATCVKSEASKTDLPTNKKTDFTNFKCPIDDHDHVLNLVFEYYRFW